jgi:hypothetical protein
VPTPTLHLRAARTHLPLPGRRVERATDVTRSGRDASDRLLRWAVRALQALLGPADAPASFEHVDSWALQAGAFRASDSMGFDGAPSMVFLNTMPRYSRAIDRPSSSSAQGGDA